MRKLIVVAAALAVIGMVVAPAIAGKPSATRSTIALDTGAGATLAAANGPKLGDNVRFRTTIEPIAGWEYPMVDLQCYQDVNGDGTVDTNLLGPDIVFTTLDRPDATFTLGGYSSIWTQRGGGEATCLANLVAIGWKGGKQSARSLATTGRWTALA